MKSKLVAVVATFAVWLVLGLLAMVVSASIFSPESREGKNLYLVLATVAGIVGLVVFFRLSKRPA